MDRARFFHGHGLGFESCQGAHPNHYLPERGNRLNSQYTKGTLISLESLPSLPSLGGCWPQVAKWVRSSMLRYKSMGLDKRFKKSLLSHLRCPTLRSKVVLKTLRHEDLLSAQLNAAN